MDENITSVETEEVAELPEETGEEISEVAEPNPGKTDADARFAQMRRENEELRKQNEQYARESKEWEQRLADHEYRADARNEALDALSGGLVQAIAENQGLSEDEVLDYLQQAENDAEAELELSQKDARIAGLEEEINGLRADMQMQEDIAELQKIDPSIKSLEDLGPDFKVYVQAGLPAVKAYYAIQAEKQKTEAKPPEEIGMVNATKAESPYYTNAEIEAMSPEELKRNYKKVLASWEHNG